MATEIRWRRGSTTANDAFLGAQAEITVDTTKNTIRVHDGSTLGGHELAKSVESTFTSRADAQAAIVPAHIDNLSVIVGGIVLQYERDASGTALVTADGATWSPLGDVHPDHFAENAIPGTTEMLDAIHAAMAWAVPLGKATHLVECAKYRISGQLRISENNTMLIGHGAGNNRSQIWVYADSNVSSVLFAPPVPDNIGGVAILNVAFENFTLFRPNAGSTAAGFHGQHATGVRFKDVASWGHKWNYRLEGCQNVDYIRPYGAAVNFAGDADSAQILIDSLVLSDGSRLRGFTHRIYGGIISGLVYEAALEVRDNDFTQVNGVYWGFCERNIRLRPSNDNARIINTHVRHSYLDGGTSPSDQIALDIDSGGFTGKIELTNFSDCVIGQMDRAVWIRSLAVVDLVEFSNCDFHNSVREMIFASSTSAALHICVKGGNMHHWARNGTAVGDENHAIRVSGSGKLLVSGVGFKTYTGQTKPAIIATNLTEFIASDNSAAGMDATPVAFSNITRYLISGNISDVGWPEINTMLRGSWTPALELGGASTGITYTSRTAYYSEANGRLHFTINMVLSSKGSATGSATINIPSAVLSGRTAIVNLFVGGLNASTGRCGYYGRIVGGSSSLSLRYHTDAGGNGVLADTDLTNTTTIEVSGWCDI